MHILLLFMIIRSSSITSLSVATFFIYRSSSRNRTLAAPNHHDPAIISKQSKAAVGEYKKTRQASAS
jgi:hypothetical protein